MHNAPQNFLFLWKRLVAALSLVAAAVLAPASAPVAGAAAGSRVGSPAVASTANTLLANVEGLVDSGQQRFPSPASGPVRAQAWAPTLWVELAVLGPERASPSCNAGPLRRPYAARSGPTRAPPSA
jgi:hypothetical protein